MQLLPTALAAGLSLGVVHGTVQPAAAGEYADGLRTGNVIGTCVFLEGYHFNNPRFGAEYLMEAFNGITTAEQGYLVDMWREDGDRSCLRAVGIFK